MFSKEKRRVCHPRSGALSPRPIVPAHAKEQAQPPTKERCSLRRRTTAPAPVTTAKTPATERQATKPGACGDSGVGWAAGQHVHSGRNTHTRSLRQKRRRSSPSSLARGCPQCLTIHRGWNDGRTEQQTRSSAQTAAQTLRSTGGRDTRRPDAPAENAPASRPRARAVGPELGPLRAPLRQLLPSPGQVHRVSAGGSARKSLWDIIHSAARPCSVPFLGAVLPSDGQTRIVSKVPANGREEEEHRGP